MIAPNLTKMELLLAKRKEANSVPESRAALSWCAQVSGSHQGQR